jgi:hypothetical protein
MFEHGFLVFWLKTVESFLVRYVEKTASLAMFAMLVGNDVLLITHWRISYLVEISAWACIMVQQSKTIA